MLVLPGQLGDASSLQGAAGGTGHPPWVFWLHTASDLLIGLACLALAGLLGLLAVRRSGRLSFPGLFWMLLALVLTCGCTHLLDAVSPWAPLGRLSGVVSLLAGAVSWATFLLGLAALPRVLAMRTPAELEQEIAERRRAEQGLQSLARELAQSEQDLRRQTSILQAVLESLGDGVIVADTGGHVLLLNKAAEHLFGRCPTDTTAQEWMASVSCSRPDGTPWPAGECPLARAARGESLDQAGLLLPGPTAGEKVWLSLTARPLHDEAGRVVGGVAVYRDVTEQQRAAEAVREGEKRLLRVIETIADGILLTDVEGRVTFANGAAERILGLPRSALLGRDFDSLLGAPASAGAASQGDRLGFDRIAGADRSLYGMNEELVRANGSHAFVSVSVAPFRDGSRRMVGFVASISDVTERKAAEEALRRSEERFRALVEKGADGIALLGEDGGVRYASPSTRNVLGYPPEAVVGTNYLDLVHPDDRAGARERFDECRRGPGRDVVLQCRVRHGDGSCRYVEGTVSNRLSDPGVGAIVFNYRDATERRRSQEQLEESLRHLHALHARLERVREEERTRIAREIHDELGQALTGMKMELAGLKRALAGGDAGGRSQPLAGKVAELSGLVDETIRTVRRIATELRPGVLDNLGLEAAVEWQAQEFERRTGISCAVAVGAPGAALGRELSTAMFRILQEALTNVARHAGASAVAVSLRPEGRDLVLEVADDGKGIGEEQAAGGGSLGLLGMRERARLLGGEVRVVGRPGAGTTVVARVPLGPPNGSSPRRGSPSEEP
jgi:PAS domain S-box-containing protein